MKSLVEAKEYKTDNKKHSFTDTMVSSTYLNERFAELSSEDYTGNDKLEQNCRLNQLQGTGIGSALSKKGNGENNVLLTLPWIGPPSTMFHAGIR